MKKKIILFACIVTAQLIFSQVNNQKQINSEKAIPNSKSKPRLEKIPPKFDKDKLNQLQLKNTSVSMPKRGYAVDWEKPKMTENTKIFTYKKVELGVHLPDSVTSKINSFVDGIENKPHINPFNPDEIDVFAYFEHFNGVDWVKKKKVNGFYYQNYNRNTRDKKVANWFWEKLPTENLFRIRFSPTLPGKWRVAVIVKLNSIEQARMGEFEFDVVDSKQPGYVKVSNNKQHFILGNSTFLPIGQNMPKPSCYIEKDSAGNILKDDYKCADCPCAGVEDWCSHLKHLPMHPKAYTTYLDELVKLKKSGANYFRAIIYPFTYEIEFEKLGNYSKRMNCVWELDQMVEKAERTNLKLNLNLFIGYPLLNAPYNVKDWDWNSDDHKDIAYCYKKELGLKDPVDFLTNNQAKKHFKNRIRYYIARYGYSTAIPFIELMSEINNKFPNNPKEVYEWNKEMTDFIKNELEHDNQLITVNYDGSGPNIEKGDETYKLKNLDFISQNIHRTGVYRDDVKNVIEKNKIYAKPFLIGEIGTGDSQVETCDKNTEWMKDLWFSLFAGAANSGTNWNQQHNVVLWSKFLPYSKFAESINLNQFTKSIHAIRKDKKAEYMALVAEDKTKTFGIIQNTTWNYYTNSEENTPCKNKKYVDKELQKFSEVKPEKKKNALIISDLQANQIYELEWFNPFTGINIDTTFLETNKDGMTILQHPTLTKEMPMIAFKIYKKDHPFDKPPQFVRRKENPNFKDKNKTIEKLDK